MLKRLLHPPLLVLICIPVLSFSALIAVFILQAEDTVPAYIIFAMSAYALTIWILALPGLAKGIRAAVMGSRLMGGLRKWEMAGRYLEDLSFRGSVSIYQGMIVNFLYVVFRIAAGIRFASVWFLSMGVYYLILGGLRAFLIVCYRRRDAGMEQRCYRKTAQLLFLLNLPMGGMILLMVWTNSGYSYPGYIIYLSALYTFYTMGTAIANIVRFRRIGSPILSAAKVLNLVAAMMSMLGLQTAMISRFAGNQEDFRRMMNGITGGVVYGSVILIAVYMLLHSRKAGGNVGEPIGK